MKVNIRGSKYALGTVRLVNPHAMSPVTRKIGMAYMKVHTEMKYHISVKWTRKQVVSVGSASSDTKSWDQGSRRGFFNLRVGMFPPETRTRPRQALSFFFPFSEILLSGTQQARTTPVAWSDPRLLTVTAK
jgi:hypothetical protein